MAEGGSFGGGLNGGSGETENCSTDTAVFPNQCGRRVLTLTCLPLSTLTRPKANTTSSLIRGSIGIQGVTSISKFTHQSIEHIYIRDLSPFRTIAFSIAHNQTIEAYCVIGWFALTLSLQLLLLSLPCCKVSGDLLTPLYWLSCMVLGQVT